MVELFKVYQTHWISMHIQSLALISGSSYRFKLVANGANEKGCKRTA
jgi:hypothetical protein